jgi:ABC-type nitrate/sulfonate/bicarbonate transport system ATPase subunit
MSLELFDVRIQFGSRPIVELSHLAVATGEIVALVGRSGCGKTSLLRMIAGTDPGHEGEIRIDGIPATPAERVERTARTLQSFPLFHWLSVRGNLELAARVRGVKAAEPDRVLREFSADQLASRMPKALSGGERCRASLAQAAMGRPRILMLDEPFTGLDTLVKDDVAQAILAFARALDACVIFVTHDLNDACRYARRIVVLAGREPSSLGEVVKSDGGGAEAQIREILMSEAIQTER